MSRLSAIQLFSVPESPRSSWCLHACRAGPKVWFRAAKPNPTQTKSLHTHSKLMLLVCCLFLFPLSESSDPTPLYSVTIPPTLTVFHGTPLQGVCASIHCWSPSLSFRDLLAAGGQWWWKPGSCPLGITHHTLDRSWLLYIMSVDLASYLQGIVWTWLGSKGKAPSRMLSQCSERNMLFFTARFWKPWGVDDISFKQYAKFPPEKRD